MNRSGLWACVAMVIIVAVFGVMISEAAVKILPFGDSITQGNAQRMSYRYQLWKKMIDAGMDVQFVGSLTTNFTGTPAYPMYKGLTFDNHNEGHYGWTVHALRDSLPNWLKKYTFDIVLFQGGTNDANESAVTVAQEIRQIVVILRTANPKAVILLGHPFQEWGIFPALCTEIDKIATELSTAQSPIVPVALEKGWVSDPAKANTTTADWVHPNTVGELLMATTFFAAVKPFIPTTGVSASFTFAPSSGPASAPQKIMRISGYENSRGMNVLTLNGRKVGVVGVPSVYISRENQEFGLSK